MISLYNQALSIRQHELIENPESPSFTECLDLMQQSFGLSEQLNDITTQVLCRGQIGIMHMFKNSKDVSDLNAAEESLRECLGKMDLFTTPKKYDKGGK